MLPWLRNLWPPASPPWLSQFCKRYVYYPTDVVSLKRTRSRSCASPPDRRNGDNKVTMLSRIKVPGRPAGRLNTPLRLVGKLVPVLKAYSGIRATDRNEIGRAHVSTPLTLESPIPSSP